MAGVLIDIKKEKTQRPREKAHMKSEAEIGEMQPQSK